MKLRAAEQAREAQPRERRIETAPPNAQPAHARLFALPLVRHNVVTVEGRSRAETAQPSDPPSRTALMRPSSTRRSEPEPDSARQGRVISVRPGSEDRVEVVGALHPDRRVEPVFADRAEVQPAVCAAARIEVIDASTAEDSELERADDRVELDVARAAHHVQVRRREGRVEAFVAERAFGRDPVGEQVLEAEVRAHARIEKGVEVAVREVAAEAREEGEGPLQPG